MEREVCISLEFAVSNSIPVGVSGCGTGGGQRFLYPWDLEGNHGSVGSGGSSGHVREDEVDSVQWLD